MQWTGGVCRGEEKCKQGFDGKLEKRTRGESTLKWESNMKINLNQIRMDVLHWIYLAQDTEMWQAVLNTSADFGYQENARNFFTCGGTICFSKRTLLRGVKQLIQTHQLTYYFEFVAY